MRSPLQPATGSWCWRGRRRPRRGESSEEFAHAKLVERAGAVGRALWRPATIRYRQRHHAGEYRPAGEYSSCDRCFPGKPGSQPLTRIENGSSPRASLTRGNFSGTSLRTCSTNCSRVIAGHGVSVADLLACGHWERPGETSEDVKRDRTLYPHVFTFSRKLAAHRYRGE